MTIGRALSLASALMASSTTMLPAQEANTEAQMLKVAPGPEYRASGFHQLLLGREYRKLWVTPVSVPVLDLATFAGGVEPLSRGGGQQTKSLRLRAKDGREFFFRSVDKDPSATLPPELRGTVAGQVVRDQTSSAFPTAPLVVARLLSAAGILHGDSRFVVLPRDTSLGEFQAEFAGLMGFLEERVGGPDGPAAHWGGSSEIIGTDSLFARASRSPNDRVDAPAFLKARLFDVMIGDWDRHDDQWVWARYGDSTPRRWLPIPRDRDQAFVKYDGFLLYVARQSSPQLLNFGTSYPYMAGATWNGRDLDRRFLVELEWPAWKSTASELQAALTDAVIDEAVRTLPPEHYALRGAMLEAALKSRRDHLLEAAKDYYGLLARQVDVHATDQSDKARVVRQSNGMIEVTLARSDDSADQPYFRRQFDPKTSKDVRLFLDGGDDDAVISGRGGGPRVRILGGDGRDRLADSSRGGHNNFYDDPAGPARTAGSSSKVDRRPYTAPRKSPTALPARDWGHRWIATTTLSFGPDIGLLLGGGRTLTTYGFRKNPYASRHRFRAAVASGPKTYRLDYGGEFRRENSTGYAEVLVHASGIDIISFHGFGNEIAAPGNNEFYRVTQNAFTVQPSLVLPMGARASLRVGPVLRYSSTDEHPGRFLSTLGNLYGTGNFGEVGGGVTLRFDSRNRVNAATKGVLLELGARGFPGWWDVDSAFGELSGEAATYLTANAPLQPTLALRAGARKLWGAFPFFEAAFIGGNSTVRLGRVNRYAGDAAAYGSIELRLALGRMKLVLPADFGVFGLADGGRVFLDGESSDRWHGAVGGGVWLAYLNRANTVSLAIAHGEERTGAYLKAGFGF